MNTYENARVFVYRHARPLELARWQYHFENGSAEAVLSALAAYQNPDGGFGHALELDFWNPDSTPIAVWAATEILLEIGHTDAAHPIVQGILRYLDSGADYNAEKEQWMGSVPSNNAHPHAVWWAFPENGDVFDWNPTAALAGFILRFADPASVLYEKAVCIARRAVDYLAGRVPFGEMHVTGCFIRLYEYAVAAGADCIDTGRLRCLLAEQVRANICPDPSKWFSCYEPKPSDFIRDRQSPFLAGNDALVRRECELIRETQDADGGWPVTWKWWTDYPEYTVSALWWRVSFCIANLRYLREFDGI